MTNLMQKFLFYNKFIIFIYMFRALCAHHQEVKIVLYSIWYHHSLGIFTLLFLRFRPGPQHFARACQAREPTLHFLP